MVIEHIPEPKIEEGTKGSLTFLANPKYTPYIYKTNASLVIVNNDFVAEEDIAPTLIRVPDAYQAFSTLLEFYNKQKAAKAGIAKTAIIGEETTIDDSAYIGHYVVIGKNVTIGKNVSIHTHVVIEDDVSIGDDTVVFQHSTIHSSTTLGDFCVVHGGCIIGSDGFGFAPQASGTYMKIPQLGKVVIEDNVELGANVTIDRATLGATHIATGVKLDNMVQVAHNVEIGAHTVIAAQTGISGSTKIGSHCVIGGQVGFAGHITIGDRVQIQGQTGVTKSIPNAGDYQGTPAMEYRSYYKSYALFKQFPKIEARLRALEKKFNP